MDIASGDLFCRLALGIDVFVSRKETRKKDILNAVSRKDAEPQRSRKRKVKGRNSRGQWNTRFFLRHKTTSNHRGLYSCYVCRYRASYSTLLHSSLYVGSCV